ncbi:MAG: cellulase family glycosylhydrolase, partial [Chloroflexi bacterium]|nr:cellulase family glycosylhydrolase [Chloroflexota bacterium]
MRSLYPYRISFQTWLGGATLMVVALLAPAAEASHRPNYLHAEGSRIVDSHDREVRLTGVNWFGLETPNYAPHGLWTRNWEGMLDQIKTLGFNTLRIPFSNQLFDPGSVPNSINFDLNPDLKGLSGLEILDKLIQGAGARGLKVILDRHRPDSGSQSDLWYTDRYSKARWIADWQMLARRYLGDDTVIGADLHNEPHGRATWGSGDPATDWRWAAERAGNAILEVNPNWLIIVQGVDQYRGHWYWWGGNLRGVAEHPVRLSQPQQLVYSTHDYGPGVYPQPWFSAPDFPHNLPGIWDQTWGYIRRQGIAPVLVGEFGGRSVYGDAEGVWQRSLVSYLREGGFSYVYWSLNPNSGDTGGILLDDWYSVQPDKQALLSTYQFPLIDAPQASSTTASAQPEARASSPRLDLRVLYRTADPSSLSNDPKPEFVIANEGTTAVPLAILELRYWYSAEGERGGGQTFHCDWAQVRCGYVHGSFAHAYRGGQRWDYLRLAFSAQAGMITPGDDTGEIKVRFNKVDWAPYRQSNDYSFGAVTSEYVEWRRVTLYANG